MTESELKKWNKCLSEKSACLYIKPTRRKHESGFRLFEVGYMMRGDESKKIVLGYSDHIYTDYSLSPIKGISVPVNIDMTMSGYIRIWNHGDKVLSWEKGKDTFVTSSAEISFLENI